MTREVGIIISIIMLLTPLMGSMAMAKTSNDDLFFDAQVSFDYLRAQVEIGPRIPGSLEIESTREYIEDVLMQEQWMVQRESFTPSDSWNSDNVELVNLIALPKWYDSSSDENYVYLAAHYDTRRLADRELDAQQQKMPVPGANDGASGVAILLELARIIRQRDIRGVRMIFFDGEDQGSINGWPWIVGSTYHADHLDDPTRIQAFVLLDMVGDEDPQFYWEGNSDRALREQLWTIAANLGYGDAFIASQKYTMIDDHVPFKNKGIPAVDIIDFDYPYWHTTKDDLDHVSPDTLEIVGKTVEAWLIANLDNGTLSIKTVAPSSALSYTALGLGAFLTVGLAGTFAMKRRTRERERKNQIF